MVKHTNPHKADSGAEGASGISAQDFWSPNEPKNRPGTSVVLKGDGSNQVAHVHRFARDEADFTFDPLKRPRTFWQRLTIPLAYASGSLGLRLIAAAAWGASWWLLGLALILQVGLLTAIVLHRGDRAWKPVLLFACIVGLCIGAA